MTLALIAWGCGGSQSDKPPLPDGPAEEQIAATVNGFFDAWNAGDGNLACSFLSERGQKLVLRIAPQLHGLDQPIDEETCPSVVEASADAIDETIGQTVTAEQVRIDPGGRAAVESEFRGELSLRRIDGEWLIEVPTFID